MLFRLTSYLPVCPLIDLRQADVHFLPWACNLGGTPLRGYNSLTCLVRFSLRLARVFDYEDYFFIWGSIDVCFTTESKDSPLLSLFKLTTPVKMADFCISSIVWSSVDGPFGFAMTFFAYSLSLASFDVVTSRSSSSSSSYLLSPSRFSAEVSPETLFFGMATFLFMKWVVIWGCTYRSLTPCSSM